MNKESEAFIRKLLSFLPSTDEEYRKSIEYNGEILETVIIEDIFMPEIIKLLKENKEVKLLEIIFNYFEEVSNCIDEHLINIFSITALEILGNDKAILEVAKKYMGPRTTQLQIKADSRIGRN